MTDHVPAERRCCGAIAAFIADYAITALADKVIRDARSNLVSVGDPPCTCAVPCQAELPFLNCWQQQQAYWYAGFAVARVLKSVATPPRSARVDGCNLQFAVETALTLDSTAAHHKGLPADPQRQLDFARLWGEHDALVYVCDTVFRAQTAADRIRLWASTNWVGVTQRLTDDGWNVIEDAVATDGVVAALRLQCADAVIHCARAQSTQVCEHQLGNFKGWLLKHLHTSSALIGTKAYARGVAHARKPDHRGASPTSARPRICQLLTTHNQIRCEIK